MMKMIGAILISFTVLVGLVGCESAEDHQHHLYTLNECKARAYGEDAGDTAVDPTWDERHNKIDRQQLHNMRVADCMEHAERTTLEYQTDKKDDYGKVEN